MDPLPPIPTPPARRWREFRQQGVPIMMFAAVVAVALWIWRTSPVGPVIVGEVEAIRADVTTTVDGRLAELRVERFQRVTAGQILAVVVTTDSDLLKAEVAAAEADLKLMRARMSLDIERNAQNHAQLRLDLMTLKIELNAAQIALRQAESEFQRVSKLHQDKLVAQGIGPDGVEGYEVALRDRDTFQNEVTEKTKLVVDLEATLERMQRDFPTRATSSPDDPVNAAIAAQEQRLRILLEPSVLKAPIDGVVSAISHRAGERIVTGTPVLTIASEQSQHIIGFIRQPLAIEPRVGMAVEVRTRGPTRQKAVAKILQVGAELQMVAAPLRVRGFDNAMERGLPFLINLPPELNVYPGELVDLVIQE